MKKWLVPAVAIVAVLFLIMFLWTRRERATMLLVNARVYTLNEERPVAEAVAMAGDRILDVGNSSDLQARFDADTTIDLGGRAVYPGFVDAHGHIEGLGALSLNVNFEGTRSVAEILARISERIPALRPGQWLRGRGWDQNDWESKAFPTAQDLDSITGTRPAYLVRIDGHAAWVNTAAMRAGGITALTPDPPGGKIMRDGSGNPTGVFIDDAMNLVSRFIPAPTMDERTAAFRLALDTCARYGLTEVHDMGVDSDAVKIYRGLRDEGELPIRVYGALEPGRLWEVAQQSGPDTSDRDGMLTFRAVKFLADGALGSRGAALLEPYSDDPPNRGLTMISHDELKTEAQKAARAGFQVCVHSIGDRANTIVLDVFEEIAKSSNYNMKQLRFRVEHAQVLAPSDIPRFQAIGVLPSMQPIHCTSDMYWAEDRLGPVRVRGAYAWRSLLETGVIIPGGSDFPVERPNPLLGFYAAISRQDESGWPEGGWYPEQKMTREEALRAFTLWGATAAFQESRKGRIARGFWADLTVLDADIMTIEARKIPSVSTHMTIVGGRIVYPKIAEPLP